MSLRFYCFSISFCGRSKTSSIFNFFRIFFLFFITFEVQSFYLLSSLVIKKIYSMQLNYFTSGQFFTYDVFVSLQVWKTHFKYQSKVRTHRNFPTRIMTKSVY